MHTCDQCGSRFTRKSNLTRHKYRCRKPVDVRKYPRDILHSQASEKRARSPDIPTFDGAEFGTGKPKSKETMDKLERFVRGELAKKKSAETQSVFNVKVPSNIHPQARSKSTSSQRVTKESQSSKKVAVPAPVKKRSFSDPINPLQSIRILPPPAKKRHGDTVDEVSPPNYSDEENLIEPLVQSKEQFNDDDDDDDQSDDGMIDISDLPPPEKIKFLPATIDGLRARFDKLFREFWQEHKHCHRNELVFLLDELKRQGGITSDTYERLNTLLAKSLGSDTESAMESEPVLSEEDQLKKTITSTADYLIEHDKKELLEIVHEIEKDEAIIDTVIELEELITVYLESEFLEGESVAEKILDLVDRLSQSKHVPKSLLLKIKMLVNDIAKNRARVEEIVNRFNQAGDDRKMRLSVIEQLVKEELLSEQQYFKLSQIIDEIDINRLTDVIKETKIGQGINFLPRKTDELLDTLRQWLLEFVENGGTALQSKISSVLNELLQRKKISEERYNELKEEHNISL